jgi:autotransporter-associated beta strand protein
MVTPPTRGVTVEANGATFITNAQWTIQSIITGPGGITLNENGWNPTSATSGFALVLTGSNTYLGATRINDGALNIQGGFAIPDTSAVTISR